MFGKQEPWEVSEPRGRGPGMVQGWVERDKTGSGGDGGARSGR